MAVDGVQGTFAEGLSYNLADSMWSSNIVPMLQPPETGIVLEDNVQCGCVDFYVNRQGYKAVVNTQDFSQFLDGPDGTRLEYFQRMMDFFGIATGIDEDNAPTLPQEYLVLKAYPNPFNSSVNLRIEGFLGDEYSIEIYDITGRRIKTFDVRGGGPEITWDGRNDFGDRVASGVYFARAGGNVGPSSVKLTLLK